MEDSETHNLNNETLKQQFEVVKKRTSNSNTYESGSHVMEYGNKSIKVEPLSLYQGFDPANENNYPNRLPDIPIVVVNQRDADLLFLWQRYARTDGVEKKIELLKEITQTVKQRAHIDNSINLLGQVLFGPQNGPSILSAVRPSGLPLVDDWQCLKSMVRLFEAECGLLTQYGMKYMRAFANICNSGISEKTMEEASMAVCSRENLIGSSILAEKAHLLKIDYVAKYSRLDGNSLNGTVPSNLNNLTTLYELDLANNQLTGSVPNLTGMSTLNYVDLSNNSFNPSEAPRWKMENGKLQGPVPQMLFSFPQLQQV